MALHMHRVFYCLHYGVCVCYRLIYSVVNVIALSVQVQLHTFKCITLQALVFPRGYNGHVLSSTPSLKYYLCDDEAGFRRVSHRASVGSCGRVLRAFVLSHWIARARAGSCRSSINIATLVGA